MRSAFCEAGEQLKFWRQDLPAKSTPISLDVPGSVFVVFAGEMAFSKDARLHEKGSGSQPMIVVSIDDFAAREQIAGCRLLREKHTCSAAALRNDWKSWGPLRSAGGTLA